MNDLPMPSDLQREQANANAAQAQTELADPPGAKLIVRLFLIPFLIVALAVGVMYLISLMAGREPTFDEAIAGLKSAAAAHGGAARGAGIEAAVHLRQGADEQDEARHDVRRARELVESARRDSRSAHEGG